MAIPGQVITVNDPGLGVVEATITTPWIMGVAEKGTVTAPASVSTKSDAIATWGEGPLTEAVCHILDIAGGPVIGQRITGSVAGASGAVTPTRVTTSTGTVVVTVGVAKHDYEVQIIVLKTGTVGVGTFKYSLDDGYTFSEELVIPSGGAFIIPTTGLTVTFTAGLGPLFFEKGDRFEFDCTAPFYSTTNVADCFTALKASGLDFAFIVLVGKATLATDAATMFAALATQLAGLETIFKYARAMMDAGKEATPATITAFASAANSRILVSYGDTDMASSKAFTGWGTPKLSALLPIAARAARSLISTRLGRFASGPLTGLVAISHDEFKTEVMDQNKFATLRTFPGVPGFYITNGRMKSSSGSDFRLWMYGRIMDVACSTVYRAQLQFLNKGVRTTPKGTINDKDAASMESMVKAQLDAVLTEPLNAEGSKGHVSARNYKIDRLNNIQQTNILQATIAIRPLGYAEQIVATIGFALNVGEEG
jgi:Protein of unknown function (DUF2586)